MASIGIASKIEEVRSRVIDSLPSKAFQAANELRNAGLEKVFPGTRSGKSRRAPGGGRYTASAPGEPPAWRTGTLARSFRPVTSGAGGINPAIESGVFYADYMEHGTPGGMIAPRPFAEKIVEEAWSNIAEIYREI